MKVKSWKEHEVLAEQHMALGDNRIYLSSYDGCEEFPWKHVTSCEPGGSHRLEISTDVRFNATGPSGLIYSWSFDIEPRSANGKGSYDIATGEISRIMPLLSRTGREQLKNYLAVCAKAVRSKAEEWNDVAQKQYGTAHQLEVLSR